jgi:hypothetical protein
MPGAIRSNNPTINAAIPAIMINHQGTPELLVTSDMDGNCVPMYTLLHTYRVLGVMNTPQTQHDLASKINYIFPKKEP